MTQTTDQYGISVLLQAKILDAQKQMNRNLTECLFGDDLSTYVPTIREKITNFFKEIKNRICNAYDCLVKGVDPYDGY